MSATIQTTDADATIQTDDGPMPAHVAIPSGTPKGAVVVLQEAFGVTAHIQDVTRRFARAGWHALAPALFHREGLRTVLQHPHKCERTGVRFST